MVYGEYNFKIKNGEIKIPDVYKKFLGKSFTLVKFPECLALVNDFYLDYAVNDFYNKRVNLEGDNIYPGEELLEHINVKNSYYLLGCGNHVEIMGEYDVYENVSNEVVEEVGKIIGL